MSKIRPVNLDLGTLSFPPMAIVSILHRISGVVLFLLLPVMICFLGKSLASAESFANLKELFLSPWTKLVLWLFCAALSYHLLAGIRHILMDMGFGEELSCARRGALIVIGLEIIAMISLGIWIW